MISTVESVVAGLGWDGPRIWASTCSTTFGLQRSAAHNRASLALDSHSNSSNNISKRGGGLVAI